MISEEEFDEIFAKITLMWNRREFAEALSKLEEVCQHATPEKKAQCLLYSGMIQQDQGLLEGARRAWLEAIPLSDEGTYLRCSLQNNIGKSLESEGRSEDAITWYRAAVQTCANGDEFAANNALNALIELNGGRVSKEDESAVAAALKKSWRVLELPGTPNLSNLPEAVKQLSEGFSNRFNEIINAD